MCSLQMIQNYLFMSYMSLMFSVCVSVNGPLTASSVRLPQQDFQIQIINVSEGF